MRNRRRRNDTGAITQCGPLHRDDTETELIEAHPRSQNSRCLPYQFSKAILNLNNWRVYVGLSCVGPSPQAIARLIGIEVGLAIEMGENEKRELHAQRGALPGQGLWIHESLAECRVEARKLAHEIVEALVGGGEFLQCAPQTLELSRLVRSVVQSPDGHARIPGLRIFTGIGNDLQLRACRAVSNR